MTMTNKRTTAAVVTALAGCAFAASNTVALADTSGGAEPGTTTTTVKPKPFVWLLLVLFVKSMLNIVRC